VKIVIIERGDLVTQKDPQPVFQARNVDDVTIICGWGTSERMALGDMVMKQPHLFGVEIEREA
jgi:hypothetical protein